MIFLADENLPRPAIEALREAGFDVLWITEDNPGATDDEVLELSVSSGRTLLTLDKDFGELAYHRRLPAQCGVVLFRLAPQDPAEIASIAVFALQSRNSWAGHFSVITRERIRMRPLPPLPS
jgi:predicted nuclease of predicted toxin-antitoxin system